MNVTLPLYDALISIRVAPEKAQAVVSAMEAEVSAVTASGARPEELASVKTTLEADIRVLRAETSGQIDALRLQIDALRLQIDGLANKLTLRLGGMLAGGIALLATLIGILRL